jgi:hypothetical protein
MKEGGAAHQDDQRREHRSARARLDDAGGVADQEDDGYERDEARRADLVGSHGEPSRFGGGSPEQPAEAQIRIVYPLLAYVAEPRNDTAPHEPSLTALARVVELGEWAKESVRGPIAAPIHGSLKTAE